MSSSYLQSYQADSLVKSIISKMMYTCSTIYTIQLIPIANIESLDALVVLLSTTIVLDSLSDKVVIVLVVVPRLIIIEQTFLQSLILLNFPIVCRIQKTMIIWEGIVGKDITDMLIYAHIASHQLETTTNKRRDFGG